MLVVVALALSLARVDSSPCANPRAAAATIFSNLQEGRLDARRAARCTEATLSLSERERGLVTLKEALDAVGGRVKIEEISSDGSFVDPKTFEPTVVIARELPSFRLERFDDGQWLVPASVISQAQKIRDSAVAVDLATLRKHLPSWASQKVFGIAPWQLFFFGVLVALGWLVRFILVNALIWKSQAIRDALKITTSKEALRNALIPFGNLALAAVVMLGLPSLALGGRASLVMGFAVKSFVVITALTFCYRMIDVAAEQLAKGAASTSTTMDDHLVPLVRRSVKLAVILLSVVLVLQFLGVNVGSLVAGLGIGGLAVALAAKDTIGNFFGSVAIFLDRPFQIGDWVVVGTDVQGTIEHVGFRSTQVRTIRDTVVSVPNAKLADATIDNLGARRFRHVRFAINLHYETSPEQIESFCEAARRYLHAHPRTRKDEIFVYMNDLGDSSLVVVVHFYLVLPSWGDELQTRHEILLDLVRMTRRMQITLALPTRTLQLAKTDEKTPSKEELAAIVRAFAPPDAAQPVKS